MKNSKKLAMALAVLMIVSVLALPVSAAWGYRQQKANDILYSVRSELGYGDSTMFGAATNDLYQVEVNGSNLSGSFYFSSRTGYLYFADGTTIYVGNGYCYDGNGNNNNANGNTYYKGTDLATGMAYRWGSYLWYQSKASYNQFFRIDNGNKLVWATDNQNSSIPSGTFQGYNKYPSDGYYQNAVFIDTTVRNNGVNSSYGGKSLYAGTITGVDAYINLNEATCLAKILYTSTYAETSTTRAAGVGWAIVEAIGVGNITASRLKTVYPFYDDNAPTSSDTRDYLALAKDILFRKAAETAGMTYVGRVVPASYRYMYQYGNGTGDVFVDNTYRNAYTYPAMWQNGTLRTPYNN